MSQFKKSLAIVLLLSSIFLSEKSIAADLVVQEAGPVGTYATITSAVAASTDGDRIIINNKPSGLPWNEDIFINKSLTFLSAVDNDQFFVQGEYTIQHAPGREISIVGMENADGSITSIAPGATSRTILNVMWCTFTSGGVDVDHAFFELNLASSKFLTGSFGVKFVYGKVIGNEMGGSKITLESDGVSEEDSVHVVGNANLDRIICNTTTHYIYISNNYAISTGGLGGTSGLIRLSQTKNGAGVNVIRNNSIRSSYAGIEIQSPCAGKILIYNNLIDDGVNGDYGIINQSSATLTVSFNFIDLSFDNAELSGIVDDGTNTLSSSISMNTDGSSNWVGTTDGGSPAITEYDLNLTRNDPGCFGGSYSHANFFPIDGTSSKVYYLKMPSQILVGGSNAVTGFSFDR